jgi:hypothetical protein
MPSDVAIVYSGWTSRILSWFAPVPMRALSWAWIASTLDMTPR